MTPLVKGGKMLTKREVLRVSKIPEALFKDFQRTRLIPQPRDIIWLNPISESECFPDYTLVEAIHLKYLKNEQLRSTWELKKYLFGGEVVIKYEADLNRMCGDVLYEEVHGNEAEVHARLYQKAENSFPTQKIVSATFRCEKVKGKPFLILSRLVLKPRKGFFQVEIKGKQSEDSRERTTQVYRLAIKERSHE